VDFRASSVETETRKENLAQITTGKLKSLGGSSIK
jgi:hypothetical protein